jgi:hypothetical protein
MSPNCLVTSTEMRRGRGGRVLEILQVEQVRWKPVIARAKIKPD